MAEFIKGAIKRQGRLRKMLGKKPGEKITEDELNMLAARARKMGGEKGRSLAAAVALARRFQSGDLKRGKSHG